MSDTVNTSEGIQIPQGILYVHTDPSYITPRGKVSTEDTEIDLRHISRAEDIIQELVQLGHQNLALGEDA